jgi:hypothetical protein
METTCSSKTSADFQWTTRRYIPGDGILYNHRCENLKSYIIIFVLIFIIVIIITITITIIIKRNKELSTSNHVSSYRADIFILLEPGVGKRKRKFWHEVLL